MSYKLQMFDSSQYNIRLSTHFDALSYTFFFYVQ